MVESLWRVLRLALRYRSRFTWFIAVSLVFSGCTIAFAALAKMAMQVLDTRAAVPWMTDWFDLAADDMRRAYLVVLGLSVVALFGKCLSQYLRRYLQGWLTQRVVLGVQEDLAGHLLSLDLEYFQAERAGDLISRMTNDLGLLRNSVKLLCVALTRPIELISLLAYILVLNWRLALLGLIAAPIGGYFIMQLSRKMRKASRRALEKRADLTSVMVQFLNGIRTVKAFACEQFERDQFFGENRKLFNEIMRFVRARARVRPITEMVSGLGALVVLYVGGEWYFNNKISIDELVGFVTALGFMYNPAKELSTANSELQETLAGADRVFEVMNLQPAIQEGTQPLPPFSDAIRFENLSFSYVDGTPVLKNIDLTLRKGECVALVGPSGAGKSTLTDLLLRFFDPQEGRIAIDGIDIREVTFASLREQIALVGQHPFLFNSSIRDNIAYGRDDATLDAIEAAAQAANIHDEIVAMRGGYDAPAGERGDNLSGGQRQRVTIARAIFKDAPILVLDEATSSLDSESERQVQIALDHLMEGRTSLIIAHRLSTVRHADRILVLEDGRISAEGTHDELLETSATYARLVHLQLGSAETLREACDRQNNLGGDSELLY